MEFLNGIDYADLFQDLTSWVGVAAMAAAITPTDKDNKFVIVVKNILDFVGFNFGFAKNQK